jgi:hypothetical protein
VTAAATAATDGAEPWGNLKPGPAARWRGRCSESLQYGPVGLDYTRSVQGLCVGIYFLNEPSVQWTRGMHRHDADG